MKAHILYRFLDEHGRLLYVGITANPVSRFRQHKQSKDWWREVRQIIMQHYDSREELSAAEVEAIINEKPMHNVMHNGLNSTTVSMRSVAPQWICHDCGRRIKGKNDVLWLSMAAMRQAEELERWERKPSESDDLIYLTRLDLAHIPDEGKWQITCDKCWKETNDEYYVINLNRIATWCAVADWSAHLLEKGFLPFTNWSAILRNAGAKE